MDYYRPIYLLLNRPKKKPQSPTPVGARLWGCFFTKYGKLLIFVTEVMTKVTEVMTN